MQQPMQPLTPNILIHERYKVDSLLGQGGMSRVYSAEDERLNVRVAVKENLQTDPQARAQFHREAEFLARLSHPNLPRVTDYFDDPATGRQYLVMDYVEGEDLGAMVQRAGPLPEKQAVGYIVQILDALQYMHEQQAPIIHRDIKPSNIKITPQGKAVLVDFGIAKMYEATAMTMTGARAVTPGFAPPEQYGMRTDARSDIYAVGATLYTLLTGQIPPESTLRVANLVTLPPLKTLVPTISPQVDNAIKLAMEPDTTLRWNSAQAFRNGLLGTPPPAPPSDATIAAPPPSSPRPSTNVEAFPSTVRAPAPTKQSPPIPLLAIGALVLLVLIGGGIFWFTQNNNAAPAIVPTQIAESTATTVPASATFAPTTAAPSPTSAPTTAVPTSVATNPPTVVAATAVIAVPTEAASATVLATATLELPTLTLAPTLAPTSVSPVATSAPAATTAITGAPDTISVVSARMVPAEPHRGDRVQFFITFHNTFADTQNRTWQVLVYQQGNLRKSFWDSRDLSRNIPVGDTEIGTLPSDPFCLCGAGLSESFVLHVQDVGSGQSFNSPDGTPYSLAFTVNP